MCKIILKSLFSSLVFLISLSAFAVELRYEFTGNVVAVAATPFGQPIATATPVSGRFVYETNSLATHPMAGCDCSGYLQQHINGFSIDIGHVSFVANEYVIQIQNDIPRQPVGTKDVLAISFSSPGFFPPLESPLFVNGVPTLEGVATVSFTSLFDPFADSSLPLDINAFNFDPLESTGLISDNIAAIPTSNVFFTFSGLVPLVVMDSDHDLDVDVDGDDFLIWQRFAGSTSQNGDADSNGIVGDNDLVEWRTQYGASLPPSAVSRVPEPTGIGVFTLGAVCCLLIRFRI